MRLAVVAALLVTAACAGTAAREGGRAPLDAGGRMHGYVESRRVTDFCPEALRRAADERCTVTRGWDYAAKRAVVRTYDPTGVLVSEDHPDGADLSLVAEESARVEALLRHDPRTAPVVNRPGVMVWAGGFVMREPGDRFCDRGSRCIRAIAAANNGDDVVLHAVVDLVADRVVYPSYSPGGTSAARHQEH